MKRGVRFRLVVPGPIIDTDVVRRAGRSTWGPLLAAGAQVYEYQPTMYHCKVMIVDGPPGLGRLDQFRPALVSPERRGEPQRLRPGIRGGAGARLRAGRRAVQTRYARRLGRPAVARKLMEHAAALLHTQL
jgi:hypothetical protein